MDELAAGSLVDEAAHAVVRPRRLDASGHHVRVECEGARRAIQLQLEHGPIYPGTMRRRLRGDIASGASARPIPSIVTVPSRSLQVLEQVLGAVAAFQVEGERRIGA